MLRTISLNNQASCETNEVGGVGSKRLLPLEFPTGQPLVAQQPPQRIFGRRGISPQGARSGERAPSPSHRCAAGPFLPRKGGGGVTGITHHLPSPAPALDAAPR